MYCSKLTHQSTHFGDQRAAVQQHYEMAQALIDRELSGCAILDSGASAGMTSDNVLVDMQEAYQADGEGLFTEHMSKPNRIFTIADGSKVKVGYKIPINPISESPFAGRSDVLNGNANEPTSRSPMLIGSDYLKANRCTVDFKKGIRIYKDEPDSMRRLKLANNGHTLLMPISRSVRETLPQDELEELARPDLAGDHGFLGG